MRVLLPGALAALISGALAYAAISLATGGSPAPSAVASQAPAWLGVEMASAPSGLGGFQFGNGSGGPVSPFAGVLITSVAPGSPAASAGLQRGDMLTNIAGRQVTTPATVESVIAGLHAGDHVEIQFTQDLINYASQVTLSQRPANSP
jgi:putative serine protease PepD